jgi:D-tyrosyl-tRNA(Tyr) deacylase
MADKAEVNISARIPKYLHDLLKARAAKDAVSKTTVLRRALVHYLTQTKESTRSE